MEIKTKNEKENFTMECNTRELETIYQGLILMYNNEKDESIKNLIKKQVCVIEKTVPLIEY